ncbi:phosphogluconate dehydrogenase (NAD(+)-dependent, decarboxylating) [Halalkalibacter krulwichiae]|uniref:6-phosphogluconate dehydrogenase, NAD(+)-dependent, decarboxylating n=1 Tax=Halalkalibacter krulwichiae TaxID=199441 RepID=A0A1X9MHI1_9BACI|nr:decarboxylating 6-phosphogluconate dehydrogenase [Halalkalibacter krulwichiae]ARK32908.1 6-phosphogluconate dehydrogenase, NAD(+)-dependent, decarboxylating [Halalkalibacter krulwichiae]
MQVGMIGLGKMGYQLTLNLLDKKHDVVAYDVNTELIEKAAKDGATVVKTIERLIRNLNKPRTVWMMVPAGEITESVFQEVLSYLEEGDRLIDGGNAHYQDSLKRSEVCKDKGVFFFDCGTSGGVEGARNGACTMIGGDEQVFTEIEPIFRDLTVENGYLYAGEVGSGHFLKMVHNGIEYGMMQAIAEGFELLEKSQFNYDYEKVAKVWNNGSVIRSWLMELTENAFAKDEKLEGIKGVMHSSGEGKWTVETALDLQTPAPVITLALMMRYRSLADDTFTGKVVAALRNEFGGHAVERSEYK